MKSVALIACLILFNVSFAQVNVEYSGAKGTYTFSKPFKSIKSIPRFSEWDSLPNGKWIQLYEGGQKAMEYTMKNHLLNGPVKGYYPDGSLRFEFKMHGNYIDGEFKEYYPSGKLWRLFNYFEGFMDGPWYMWYESGVKQAEGHHKNERKVGKLYRWYENGKMQEERTYVNDTINGLTVFWYESGIKMMEGNQHPIDVKRGHWTYWWEDGTKHKECEYKDGLELVHNAWNRKGQQMVTNGEGKYQFYNTAGVKLIEGLYHEGYQEGPWLIWDEKNPKAEPKKMYFLRGKKTK